MALVYLNGTWYDDGSGEEGYTDFANSGVNMNYQQQNPQQYNPKPQGPPNPPPQYPATPKYTPGEEPQTYSAADWTGMNGGSSGKWFNGWDTTQSQYDQPIGPTAPAQKDYFGPPSPTLRPDQYYYADFQKSMQEPDPQPEQAAKAAAQAVNKFFSNVADSQPAKYIDDQGNVHDATQGEANAYYAQQKQQGKTGLFDNIWNTVTENFDRLAPGWNQNPGKYLVNQQKNQQEASGKVASILPWLVPGGAPVMAGLGVAGFATDVAAKARLAGFSDLAKGAQTAYNEVVEPVTSGTWNSLAYDVIQGKFPGSTMLGQAGQTLFDPQARQRQAEVDATAAAQDRYDQYIRMGYTPEQALAAAQEYYKELAKNPLKAAQAASQRWMEKQNPLTQLAVGWFNPIQNKAFGYALGAKTKDTSLYQGVKEIAPGIKAPRGTVDPTAPRTDILGRVNRALDSVQPFVAPGSWVGKVADVVKTLPGTEQLAQANVSPQQLQHQWNRAANSALPKLVQFAKDTGQKPQAVFDLFIDDQSFRNNMGFGLENGPQAFKAGQELANSMNFVRAQAQIDKYNLGDNTAYNVTPSPTGGRLVNGFELSTQGERISKQLVGLGQSQDKADLFTVMLETSARVRESSDGIPASETLKQIEYKLLTNPDPTALNKLEDLYEMPYRLNKELTRAGNPKDAPLLQVAQMMNRNSAQQWGPLKSAPGTPEYVQEITDRASQDFDYWLRNPPDKSGLLWYQTDNEIMERNLDNIYPEFRTQPWKRDLFRGLLASTSIGQTPSTNFRMAERMWNVYKQLGRVPDINPATGKKWSNKSDAMVSSWNRIQRLIDEKGEKGAAEWLNSDHTHDELKQYGANVNDTMDLPQYTVEMQGKKKVKTLVPGTNMGKGYTIIGPKIGSFASNLAGFRDYLTADMWWARSFGRWRGDTTERVKDDEGNLGFAPVGGPASTTERRAMRQVVRNLAARYNIDVAQAQAAIWYGEQQAWKMNQAKVESDSYAKVSGEQADAAGVPRVNSTDTVHSNNLITPKQSFVLSGELQMPDSAAFGKNYPELTDRSVVDPQQAQEITYAAMLPIVDRVRSMFPELQFGGVKTGLGRYDGAINPNYQVEVIGDQAQVEAAAAALGIATKQNQMAYRRTDANGNITAFTYGFDGLPEKLTEGNWRDIWDRASYEVPELRDIGFSSTLYDTGDGVVAMNFAYDPETWAGIEQRALAALDRAAEPYMTSAQVYTRGRGNLKLTGNLIPEEPNDWSTSPNGEAYHTTLLAGRPDLPADQLANLSHLAEQSTEAAFTGILGPRLAEWRKANGIPERPAGTGTDTLYQRVGQNILGTYQKLDPATGQKVTSLLQNSRPDTVIHEMGHYFREAVLSGQHLKAAEKFYNVQDGNWDVNAEERFADDFMAYVEAGKAASPALQNIFERFKNWLGRVWATIRPTGNYADAPVHPDIAKVFDHILGRDRPDSARFNTENGVGQVGSTVTNAKGVDISRQFAQGNMVTPEADYAKIKSRLKNWETATPEQLIEAVQKMNGVRSGAIAVDEFGKQRELSPLEDLGIAGKVVRGPTVLGDWMSETMLNSIGRFFRDPAGNLIKAAVEGYLGINSKARIRQLDMLGMKVPDLTGGMSMETEGRKHQSAFYQGSKFVAQWPGMVFGGLVLRPLNKLGVPGIGKDVNESVGLMEAGTKASIYTTEALKGYHSSLSKSHDEVMQLARQEPGINRLIEDRLLTEQQVSDIITGHLSFGDVRKLLTNEYHFQNYGSNVVKQGTLLDPHVNPHSWVKDAFDQLPPDATPGHPQFQLIERSARQNVDDATWAVLDAEVQNLQAAGGDPAFAASINFPEFMPATMDNWQAGEEPHFAARFGNNPKPTPAALYTAINGAKAVKIGNSNVQLNSTAQLRRMARGFMTAQPAMRQVIIEHFQRADQALRRESGNTYKLDFGTMEPVNIQTGTHLSTELGITNFPRIAPASKQLIDPAERQRLIDVSEQIFGPGSQAVADMAQAMADLTFRLGDLGQKPWNQMHPAEQQLAISIVSREAGYPDPTSARQAYGLAMEQRQAVFDYIDMLKGDADARALNAGTLNNNIPGLDAQQTESALDWLRNQKAQITAKARIEGERQGQAKVDKMFFDYQNKSRIDQALSNWVPFQFWGRKNIAYLFKHFTENPAHFAALVTFYNAMIAENERAGVPEYARAYLKLWQNADGSYTMLNFSALNPFNFGDSDIPLTTVKPDDRLAPDSAKRYTQQSLVELALGKDLVSRSGEYYKRNLGGFSQFFRVNPILATAGRLGLMDQFTQAIGVQGLLENMGEKNQNHFGDDTTQGLGLIASRNITRSTGATTGLTDVVRNFANSIGINMMDLDFEGLPNELMGRLRKAIEKIDNPDYEKLYGKPKTKFDREVMLRVNQGTISKDEGYALMAEFREGKLSLSGAKILDAVLSEDAPRLGLSLLGLSTITTNTPRDQLVQVLLDKYMAAKGDNGSYNQNGKFIEGKTQQFFKTREGQAASVLFGSGDSAKKLRQTISDDQTRQEVSDLYSKQKDISTSEFYKQMEAIKAKNPAYFAEQMKTNQGKAAGTVPLKPGEPAPRPEELSQEAYDKKKAYDLTSEEYRNLDKGRLSTLQDLNRVSQFGKNGTADIRKYNDAQIAFIEAHPEWYKEYQDRVEKAYPVDPIVLQKGQDYSNRPRDLEDRKLAQKQDEFYAIGGDKYDKLIKEAKALYDKGDKAAAFAIYNSKFVRDVEASQTTFKKDNPALAAKLDQAYTDKTGKPPRTEAEVETSKLESDFYNIGGDKYDKQMAEAKRLNDAGKKNEANAIYNSRYIKDVEAAQEAFKKDHPELALKLNEEYTKKTGKQPQTDADREYYDLLDQFKRIGGDNYDAKAKAVADAYAAGNKALGAKLYKDPEYLDAKTAREVFKRDHPEFARKYDQYNKDTYGTPTDSEKALADVQPSGTGKAASSGYGYSSSSRGSAGAYRGGGSAGGSKVSNRVPNGTQRGQGAAVGDGGAGPTAIVWNGAGASAGKWFGGTANTVKPGRQTAASAAKTPAGQVASAPLPQTKSQKLSNVKNSVAKLPSVTAATAEKHRWTQRATYQLDLGSATEEAIRRNAEEADVVSVPMYQPSVGYVLFSKVRAELDKSDLSLLTKALDALRVYYPEFVQSVQNALAKPASPVYNAGR